MKTKAFKSLISDISLRDRLKELFVFAATQHLAEKLHGEKYRSALDRIEAAPPDFVERAELEIEMRELARAAALAERAAPADTTEAEARAAHWHGLATAARARAGRIPSRPRHEAALRQAARYQSRADSADRTLARLRRHNADINGDRQLAELQRARIAAITARLAELPAPIDPPKRTRARRTPDDLRELCKRHVAHIEAAYSYEPDGTVRNNATDLYIVPAYIQTATIPTPTGPVSLPWRWIIGTLLRPDAPTPVISRAPNAPDRWAAHNLHFTARAPSRFITPKPLPGTPAALRAADPADFV